MADVIEMPELTTNTSLAKEGHHKEIMLLLMTIILLIFSAELFFRAYYWQTGKTIAADDAELCYKQMKNPKKYFSVNPDEFKFTQDWEEDPLIGLVPRKNNNNSFKIKIQNANIETLSIEGNIPLHQQHNSQGLTNIEEFTPDKPSSVEKRIALFGDSFTCGSEGALRFNMGYVLKAMVPNIEVLNFCIVGHGIDHMYARYVLQSPAYKPDIVIFNVLVDDLRRAYGCILFRPNLTIQDGRIIIGQRKWNSLKDFYFNYSPPKYESYLLKRILWTINQQTEYSRDLNKGLELFKIMIQELKTAAEKQNQILIINPVLEQEPNEIEKQIYQEMMASLKEKNIMFIDTKALFESQRKKYNNQSFYYIRGQDHYKHFSPIGNAVFAQGLKKMLESAKAIPKTQNYDFANFEETEILYLIPRGLMTKKQLTFLAIPAIELKNMTYPNSTVMFVR